MKQNQVLIIIPAYNEENTIASVIDSIRENNKTYDIVVINDGSTDKTSVIAQNKNVTVINLSSNIGIGGAVQTGLKYAYRNKYDIAIQVDADGQHNPKYIPKLLKALDKNTDMVIGSRFLSINSYRPSIPRRVGIKIFSLFIRLTCKLHISDTTSGFRAFNKKTIKYLSYNYLADCPEPESIVNLTKNGCRIKEIPVEMNKRSTGQSSVTPFKAILFTISSLIAILIGPKKT